MLSIDDDKDNSGQKNKQVRVAVQPSNRGTAHGQQRGRGRGRGRGSALGKNGPNRRRGSAISSSHKSSSSSSSEEELEIQKKNNEDSQKTGIIEKSRGLSFAPVLNLESEMKKELKKKSFGWKIFADEPLPPKPKPVDIKPIEPQKKIPPKTRPVKVGGKDKKILPSPDTHTQPPRPSQFIINRVNSLTAYSTPPVLVQPVRALTAHPKAPTFQRSAPGREVQFPDHKRPSKDTTVAPTLRENKQWDRHNKYAVPASALRKPLIEKKVRIGAVATQRETATRYHFIKGYIRSLIDKVMKNPENPSKPLQSQSYKTTGAMQPSPAIAVTGTKTPPAGPANLPKNSPDNLDGPAKPPVLVDTGEAIPQRLSHVSFTDEVEKSEATEEHTFEDPDYLLENSFDFFNRVHMTRRSSTRSTPLILNRFNRFLIMLGLRSRRSIMVRPLVEDEEDLTTFEEDTENLTQYTRHYLGSIEDYLSSLVSLSILPAKTLNCMTSKDYTRAWNVIDQGGSIIYYVGEWSNFAYDYIFTGCQPFVFEMYDIVGSVHFSLIQECSFSLFCFRAECAGGKCKIMRNGQTIGTVEQLFSCGMPTFICRNSKESSVMRIKGVTYAVWIALRRAPFEVYATKAVDGIQKEIFVALIDMEGVHMQAKVLNSYKLLLIAALFLIEFHYYRSCRGWLKFSVIVVICIIILAVINFAQFLNDMFD